MRRIIFRRARTLDEALAERSGDGRGGRVLAGGTDLIVELRGGASFERPCRVLDVGGLRELSFVAEDPAPSSVAAATPAVIRLGALLTHTACERNPVLRRCAPLLCQASAQVGSPQIRNRGTVGGNVMQASPCADTLPPLLALESVLSLRSAQGRRLVPLAEAIRAPYQTVLQEDEILTEIHFAAPPESAASAFLKLGRRNALSISRMSVAVVLRQDGDGRLKDVRIAAGSVAPSPRRFPEVERLLLDQVPTDALIDAAGAELAAVMIRISGRRWSTPYKEPVVMALMRRTLRRALERR